MVVPSRPAAERRLARPRLRCWALNLALALVSVALVCLAIEAGLRVAGYPRGEMRFLCYEPIMGNVFCPGETGRVRTREGERELRINAEGLADSEHTRAKPDAVFRIALLGDSMVAGLDVAPAERIASLWERALAARTGEVVQVVNFSVPGTGTWEQLQLYRLRAHEYRPDLVVLAFFWGNDVWNNAARLARGANNPLEDDYRVRAANEVRVLQRALSRWVWNHSVAYQLLRSGTDRFDELRRQAAIHGWGQALSKLGAGAAGSSAENVTRHLAPQLGMPEYDWSSPDWDLTRKLIEKLDAEVRASGARLAVFHIPAIIHERQKLPRSELEAFLAARTIAAFSLFDLYAAQDESTYLRQFIAGDVHWTREGHALAAAHTLPALESLVQSLARR